MPSLLEQIADTAKLRHAIDADFRDLLVAAREHHSWAELAAVAGMSPSGIRYIADPAENQRKKGERHA